MGDENEGMRQTLRSAMQVIDQQQGIIRDQKGLITDLVQTNRETAQSVLDIGASSRKTALSRSKYLSLDIQVDEETHLNLRVSPEMLEDEDVRAILTNARAIVETLRKREETRSTTVDAIRKMLEDTGAFKQILRSLCEKLPDPEPDTDANSTGGPVAAAVPRDAGYAVRT